MTTLGNLLKEKREENGYSIQQVSKELKIATKYL
ncbi:MAG: helix-turn-helix domain-containing protein, partial [Calditerrivibrio sp.]|nr:helix-turn-helix domain-containing protein [Calditerrivibrio sp.]